MSINKILDHDVRVIKKDLQQMIVATKKQYENTQKALINSDYELAKQVINNDKKINDQQNDFTTTALWKITKQNMVASDLRLAVGGILISREIERIADYAKMICQFVIDYHPSPDYVDAINEGFDALAKMHDMVAVLIDHYDIDLTNQVKSFEQEVGLRFAKGRDDAIVRIRHATTDEEAILLYGFIRQMKKIERAADHIMSIQEILNFIRTGKFDESSNTVDQLSDIGDEESDTTINGD